MLSQLRHVDSVPMPEHAGVGLARVAAVAPRRLAVRRVERAVHHPQVGPRPGHREQPVADADGLQPVELGVAPRRDAGVAVALGGAVAGDELGVVRRPRVERVERRIARRRLELVDHRGVEPVGEHLGTAGVRRRPRRTGRSRAAPSPRGCTVRPRAGRMFGSTDCEWYAPISEPPPELPSSTIALDALLAQEAHADGDVGERVVEHEVRLGAAEAGVPPEEAEAAPGHEVGQVVLGEVDVVVGGDERGRRVRVAGRRVPEALARVAAGAGAPDDRGGQPDERALDAGQLAAATSSRLPASRPRPRAASMLGADVVVLRVGDDDEAVDAELGERGGRLGGQPAAGRDRELEVAERGRAVDLVGRLAQPVDRRRRRLGRHREPVPAVAARRRPVGRPPAVWPPTTIGIGRCTGRGWASTPAKST